MSTKSWCFTKHCGKKEFKKSNMKLILMILRFVKLLLKKWKILFYYINYPILRLCGIFYTMLKKLTFLHSFEYKYFSSQCRKSWLLHWVEKVDFSTLLLKVVFGQKVVHSCEMGHLVWKNSILYLQCTTIGEISFLEPHGMYYSGQ